MSAEVIGFAYLFDSSFILTSELKTLINPKITLNLFTDLKSKFDMISK